MYDEVREGDRVRQIQNTGYSKTVLSFVSTETQHPNSTINFCAFIYYVFITLWLFGRTLGNFAGILSERKNIHHSISSSLDSNDLVELEAAIAAAKQYAAQSKYV